MKLLSQAAVSHYNEHGYYAPVRATVVRRSGGDARIDSKPTKELHGPEGRRCGTRHTCCSPGSPTWCAIRGSSMRSRTSSAPTSCAGAPPFSSRSRGTPASSPGTRIDLLGPHAADVVTAWVAFTEGNVENGAMRVIPGPARRADPAPRYLRARQPAHPRPGGRGRGR